MMPQLTFVFLGFVALILSIGAVVRVDEGTRILSSITGGVCWFLWGASAVSVGVPLDSSVRSVELPALVYLGYLLGGVLVIIGLYRGLAALREEQND